MSVEFLYRQSETLTALALFVLLLLAGEVGYRAQVGILGLLLAFTSPWPSRGSTPAGSWSSTRPNHTLQSVLVLALALLVSLVVLIILDPARPRRGLIRIAQQSLIDLKASPGRAR